MESTISMHDHDTNHPAYSIGHRQSRDADEQAEFLSELGDVIFEQTTLGKFDGRFEEIGFRGIQLLRSRTNQAIHQAGLMHADYRVLAVPMAMDGTINYRGQAAPLGSVFTSDGGNEIDFQAPKNLDFIAVSIPRALLSRHMQDVEQRELELEQNDVAVFRPNESRLAEFRGTLVSMLTSLASTPALLQYDAVQAGMERALLSAIVKVAEHAENWRLEAGTRFAVVARAREYIHAYRDAPITVEDICRAIGTSRRTLQYSFQEVLQTTPLNYLRAVRLSGARRMLRSGNPSQTSVQDVAAYWGFWHLSHFARYYRQMFGELPSETLYRSSARRSLALPA